MAAEVIYRVFVGSTFEDLKDERAEVQRSLLKMKCLPIAMELFPSADEETWDFIKRQVAEADFYVVVIAGRYGSLATDGLSFTEKEYDYARELRKPTLTFIHGAPGTIAADRTERDPDKAQKLETFIAKCKAGPLVSFYRSPHELGAMLLASVIELKSRLEEKAPDLGYARIRDVVEYKKYADVLEENTRLKSEVDTLRQGKIEIFFGADDINHFDIAIYQANRSGGSEVVTHTPAAASWAQIFLAVADAILESKERQREIGQFIASRFSEKLAEGYYPDFSDVDIIQLIKNKLFSLGLITFDSRDTGNPVFQSSYHIWRLTEFGQKQYGIVMRRNLNGGG